jgi:hypothetical protein
MAAWCWTSADPAYAPVAARRAVQAVICTEDMFNTTHDALVDEMACMSCR